MSQADTINSGVTLAVLAGGEGRRMGKAKAEIRIHGQFVLDYLLARWNWPGPTMLVTAPGREHPPGWRGFDLEVVDPVPGEGPLRGILTALNHCSTDTIVLATVDMPGVEASHLVWLADRVQKARGSLGVFLTTLLVADNRSVEPFPAAMRRAAREIVEQQLSSGDRSLQTLARRAEFSILNAPDQWPPCTWTNLNRPEDIEQFEEP